MKSNKAFTLIELLITIAIIAILGSATVLVLNPVEMMSQARDSQRVNDLGVIKKAVDLSIFNNSSITTGTAQRVYLSLPSATAPACDASGLPTLPSGWQYVCSSATNLTKIDGTGWLPINFTSTATPAITSLPIDPINSITGGKYYTYVTGGSYELTAVMESDKENRSAVSDGGSLPGVLQVGTHIDLTPPLRDKGLVGYWGFEGTGSIINGQTTYLYDSSGKGKNGTASNINGVGMSFITGKVGNAIQLDGSDDYISIPTLYLGNGDWSVSVWIKTSSGVEKSIISNASGGPVQNFIGINTYKILYRHYDNTWLYKYGTSTVISDNNWHHLVWTNHNNKTIDLYVDGIKEVTAVSSALSSSNGGPVDRLGGAWSAGYLWIGSLDDIRAYDRTLSEIEVKSIYNATK